MIGKLPDMLIDVEYRLRFGESVYVRVKTASNSRIIKIMRESDCIINGIWLKVLA